MGEEAAAPNKPHVALKRRKQVKSACCNCRKSKTACCTERPCRRCVGMGLASTCADVPRKRRQKKVSEEYEEASSFKFVIYDPSLSSSSPEDSGSRQGSPDQKVPVPRSAPILSHFGGPSFPREASNPARGDFLGDLLQSCAAAGSELTRSSPARASPETETHRLQLQVQQLLREKEEQANMIKSLQGSLRRQQLFSGLCLSRWKLLCTGICQLQTFSDGFVKLIQHNIQNLHSEYTCVMMYPAQEFPKTQKLFGLIASGRVESLTARVPLVRGTGGLVSVFSIMQIEFDENDMPCNLTMCMKEFDPSSSVYGDMPFFEPTQVRLRKMLTAPPATSAGYPPSGSYSPQQRSPGLTVEEIYSPDRSPSYRPFDKAATNRVRILPGAYRDTPGDLQGGSEAQPRPYYQHQAPGWGTAGGLTQPWDSAKPAGLFSGFP